MPPIGRPISKKLTRRRQPKYCQVVSDDDERCEMSASVWVKPYGKTFKICNSCFEAYISGFWAGHPEAVSKWLF